jgi:hypothetical protein
MLLDELVLADENERTITVPVPAGFLTDFASIKVLHYAFRFALFALVSGYGNYAAPVQDWLYEHGQLTRKEADAVLYLVLRMEGVMSGARCSGLASG